MIVAGDIEIVRGACPHDCPDTCAMLIHRRDGRALRVQGDPDHPVTQGFLCTKVNRYVERTYHRDRLRHPMRRVGPKGSGEFEAAGWDEAISDISKKLLGVIDEHGAESVLPYSYAGTIGLVQGSTMDRRFFHRIGASLLARTICATAGMEGWRHSYGDRMGPSPVEAEDARLIVLWGTNTLTSNPHLWPAVRRARDRGARVIAIDPIRTRTAEQCDQHIAIRPGTDAALALGMMHITLRDGLEDGDFLRSHTVGWEGLSEQVSEWTPDQTAAITGIPVATIEELTRLYATTSPSFIRLNYGMQRHRGGGMAVRAVSLLPAITGAWRVRGGGATLSTSGTFPMDFDALERPDWIRPGTRTINMVRLGEALTTSDAGVGGPRVHAMVVYNSNPAAVAPDLVRVREGMRREDLFTVVLEHFQTDTADYADWVLPATTQLEHWDIHSAYGHHFVTLNQPAIDPVGDSLPNSEIFRRLAGAMGLKDPEFRESDQALIEVALGSGHPALEGITLKGLQETGYARLRIPESYLPYGEAGGLTTPSGKIEIYSADLAAAGFSGYPCYISPAEADGENAEYPLTLLSPPEHPFLNSTFVNVDALARAGGEPTALMHPADAESRQIRDGEVVRIWNDRGDFLARAVVTERVAEGVAASYGVRWARRSPEGKTVNDTTSAELTDLGGGAVFYDNAVQIALAENPERFAVDVANTESGVESADAVPTG